MEGDYAKKVTKAQGTYFPASSSSSSSAAPLSPSQLAAQKEPPNLGGPNGGRRRRESHNHNYNLLHTNGFRDIRRPSHMNGMKKGAMVKEKERGIILQDSAVDISSSKRDNLNIHRTCEESRSADVNEGNDNQSGNIDNSNGSDPSDNNMLSISNSDNSNSNFMSNGGITMSNMTDVVHRAVKVDKRNKNSQIVKSLNKSQREQKITRFKSLKTLFTHS